MLAQRTAILFVLVPALALAGCAASDTEGPVTVSEDFEKGIRTWETGADIPQDPNRPGENVSWNIDVTREQAASGSYSVNYTLDGNQDDGTIWLVRGLQVEANQAYGANVTVSAWSSSASDNTLAHLVAFLGPDRPIEEEDFPASGEVTNRSSATERGGLREPLDQQAGWRAYSFGWTAPPTEEGRLWVAVGISAVWETQLTYFVDDLEIQLEPVGDG